jgi:hypothetical protein
MPQRMSAIPSTILGALLGSGILYFTVCSQEKPAPDDPLRRIKEIASDPDSPIKFNEKLNEYQLAYMRKVEGRTTKETLRLIYCPFTGVKLPQSTRDALFTTPSGDEITKYSKVLDGVKTMEEVKTILGEPDQVFGAFGNSKRQFTYRELSETVQIIVQERNDGKIEVSFSGKEKK